MPYNLDIVLLYLVNSIDCERAAVLLPDDDSHATKQTFASLNLKKAYIFHQHRLFRSSHKHYVVCLRSFFRNKDKFSCDLSKNISEESSLVCFPDSYKTPCHSKTKQRAAIFFTSSNHRSST